MSDVISLETMLWHNGMPFRPSFVNAFCPGANRAMLAGGPHPAFEWSLGIDFDKVGAEPFANWRTFQACLFDHTNSMVTPMIPGMVFAHPWGIYSTVQLPARPHSGIAGWFTLGLRVPGKLTAIPIPGDRVRTCACKAGDECAIDWHWETADK